MKYQIIYADPPWSYSDKGCNGATGDHYETMRLRDIKNLDIEAVADKDCVLFLWATYPMMREALAVIEAWGFQYKSIAFQWIKLNKKNGKPFYGLGRWTRGNSECCLIATKGKPKRKSASVSQLIFSPLRKHSQKPDEAREKIIELMGGGSLKRLELFAREKAEGWDIWGNELQNDVIIKFKNQPNAND
jgi:site-specific DNA-methyltransferase (adenine-specific)